MKKNNNKIDTSSAIAIGYLGYIISLIQIALLLSFATTVAFDSAVQLFKNLSKRTYSLETILTEAHPVSPSDSELSIEIKLFLVLLAVAVAILSVYFVGKHSSNILKRILGRLYKKPSLSTLFFSKILVVTISFLLTTLVLLALPAFTTLLPIITGGAVIAVICFSLQHFIARRGKLPYKKVA